MNQMTRLRYWMWMFRMAVRERNMRALGDHEARSWCLYKAQGKTGVHYCPELDCMAIHDDMPEAQLCLCKRTSGIRHGGST